MIEVRIPMSCRKAFKHRTDSSGYGNVVLRKELREWLKAHITYWQESDYNSIADFGTGSLDEYYQSSGIAFKFTNTDDAILFKLTWL